MFFRIYVGRFLLKRRNNMSFRDIKKIDLALFTGEKQKWIN